MITIRRAVSGRLAGCERCATKSPRHQILTTLEFHNEDDDDDTKY